MLNSIYSTSRLVLTEQITPNEGIVKIEAIWNEFEKYEVGKDNVKNLITDAETESGSVSMRVKYRLKGDKDVVLAMSISGTLAPNSDVRKRNLYFSVSTIPLSSEFSVTPNHSYNKSIAQFNDSITLPGPDLVLEPLLVNVQPSSDTFPLTMVTPTVGASVEFSCPTDGSQDVPGSLTTINVEGKGLELVLEEISNIVLVLSIDNGATETKFENITERSTYTVNLPLGAEIIYGYIYEGPDEPVMKFASFVGNKPT